MKMAGGPLGVTDLTFRDGHQSLFATRVRTDDLVALAPEMDGVGFWSMEVWGGATFDVMTRFLNEDPWERVRRLKRALPDVRLQMLLRGQNLVGYRNYADDVVRAFVAHAAECGIDVFRVFDALNDERNFATAFEAIKATGRHIQGALSYSITERSLGGPVFTVDYYLAKARAIERMGAQSLCIKDMAGLLSPADAEVLVTALKRDLSIPIVVHSHFTSGMAYMTLLKAIEAGADVIDTCIAPFALRTSHAAVEPIVAALAGSSRDTGLDLARLVRAGDQLERIVPKYRDFLDDTKLSIIDPGVLSHQIPGGMFSNMVAQLRQADALDRLPEVYEELPRTRRELGFPPLVTPTSQIVGTQAVLNVMFGRYKMISREVKDYVFGLYGKPPAPIDPEVQRVALEGYERGSQPITGRAADLLAPEMEAAAEATKGLARDIGDVLCYALYPTTGLRFLKWKHGVEPPPPETRPRTMEDVARENELLARAKKGELVSGAPTAPPAAAGPRRFTVRMGEDVFTVEVEAGGTQEAAAGTPTGPAAPAAPGTPAVPAPVRDRRALVAPMPGLVVQYLVAVGDQVRAGQPVVVVEAMKMQNHLPSPAAGRVAALGVPAGQNANRGDVLVRVE
ncbi:MAG TPA: pyruvate carboxylase subunit B [Vicinamibacterales bacterium]|nr:pyruvate carboxylase subunit B [Vicinamibacterales bacterium]